MQEPAIQGFRLSPQQKGLWELQERFGNQPFLARCEILIEGNLQQDILRKALQRVIDRHEILRTTFYRPAGIKTIFQIVLEHAAVTWQDRALSGLREEDQNAEIERYLMDEAEHGFDLQQGPLLRVCAFRLSNTVQLLSFSLPAICADSATLANLPGELGHAYELCLNQREFADEPMQYADFSEFQHELLEEVEPHAIQGRDYWRKQTGKTVALTLPLERRNAHPREFKLDSVSFEIETIMIEQVEALSREHGSTVSSVFFTCWAALMLRIAGQLSSDLTIFKLFAGRKLGDLQGAFGLYANYLPIILPAGDKCFSEEMRVLGDTLKEAEEWQEYFDPSVSSAQLAESVAFAFETQLGPYKCEDVLFTRHATHVCLGPFKLALSCLRKAGSLRAELQYNKKVFERETIERLAGQFGKVLAAAVRSPDVPISELDLLSEAERRQLLEEFNQTTAHFPESKCIHEQFEAQTEKSPAAIAVVCEDSEISYFDLNARANQVAHRLRRLGVGPGACVGLCMHRSTEMIVGLLGILKTGGAYVPLNPEHPSARVALQLVECKARFCLTNDAAIGEALEFAGQVLDLARDRNVLSDESPANPESISRPENLAYVIYTSGSTGVPKGVAVRHRNLVNYTSFVLRRLQVDHPMHFATVSTITADLGNTCIFPALASGGCLHILSYDLAMEGTLLSQYLLRHPVDVLKIVPSHLQALLTSAEGAKILPVSYLILGGEALSWELLDRLSASDNQCEIINHYGPTETTVGSLTFSIISGDRSPYAQSVPIGRPVDNTRAYILDQHLRPVPLGVKGELHLAGAGVTAGYLNRPAETAALFIPDPFSGEADSRLYRTGDLARYLPDGSIEFMVRVDNQIKVRGYRIELGEIEAAMLQHPQIRQAVAIHRNDNGEERLVAYVVTSALSSQDELRHFLKQRLPDYMIPSAFVTLRSLPLTANGKVDRTALPAPGESREQREFVSPRTAVEQEVADIWANLLKLPELGAHDNFFDLGGHSLLATQVISRMRKAFRTEIPLRSIFEFPTVAEMALSVERSIELEDSKLQEEIEALEGLSEDEAEQLLHRERNQNR